MSSRGCLLGPGSRDNNNNSSNAESRAPLPTPSPSLCDLLQRYNLEGEDSYLTHFKDSAAEAVTELPTVPRPAVTQPRARAGPEFPSEGLGSVPSGNSSLGQGALCFQMLRGSWTLEAAGSFSCTWMVAPGVEGEERDTMARGRISVTAFMLLTLGTG